MNELSSHQSIQPTPHPSLPSFCDSLESTYTTIINSIETVRLEREDYKRRMHEFEYKFTHCNMKINNVVRYFQACVENIPAVHHNDTHSNFKRYLYIINYLSSTNHRFLDTFDDMVNHVSTAFQRDEDGEIEGQADERDERSNEMLGVGNIGDISRGDALDRSNNNSTVAKNRTEKILSTTKKMKERCELMMKRLEEVDDIERMNKMFLIDQESHNNETHEQNEPQDTTRDRLANLINNTRNKTIQQSQSQHHVPHTLSNQSTSRFT